MFAPLKIFRKFCVVEKLLKIFCMIKFKCTSIFSCMQVGRTMTVLGFFFIFMKTWLEERWQSLNERMMIVLYFKNYENLKKCPTSARCLWLNITSRWLSSFPSFVMIRILMMGTWNIFLNMNIWFLELKNNDSTWMKKWWQSLNERTMTAHDIMKNVMKNFPPTNRCHWIKHQNKKKEEDLLFDLCLFCSAHVRRCVSRLLICILYHQGEI